MDKLAELKHGLVETWYSLGEGWRQLRDRTSEALTRFTPVNRSRNSSEVPSSSPALASNWGLLAGDLYEDGDQIVVRLDVPGMVKEDLNLEVRGDALIISDEKHIEQEQGNVALSRPAVHLRQFPAHLSASRSGQCRAGES